MLAGAPPGLITTIPGVFGSDDSGELHQPAALPGGLLDLWPQPTRPDRVGLAGSPTSITRAPEIAAASSSHACSRVEASAASSWMTVTSGESVTAPRATAACNAAVEYPCTLTPAPESSAVRRSAACAPVEVTISWRPAAWCARATPVSAVLFPVPACPTTTTKRRSEHATRIARSSSDASCAPPSASSDRNSETSSMRCSTPCGSPPPAASRPLMNGSRGACLGRAGLVAPAS